MNVTSIVNILSIIVSVLIVFFIYKKLKRHLSVSSVKSSIDNKYYSVRSSLPEDTKREVADKLALINRNIKTLINYIERGNDKDSKYQRNVALLKQRYRENSITENIGMEDTTFTVNKGESIEFCITTRNSKEEVYDINKLMFVTIHELAHIGSESYNHTKEFTNFFIFLLKNAIQCNVYKYQNYYKQPEEYCGITIDKTPLVQ
jgi:hypothetical protein